MILTKEECERMLAQGTRWSAEQEADLLETVATLRADKERLRGHLRALVENRTISGLSAHIRDDAKHQSLPDPYTAAQKELSDGE